MTARPGDPLRIRADEYNAAVEAGKAFRTLGGRGTFAEERRAVFPGVPQVWIRKGSQQATEVKPGEFCTFGGTPRGFDDVDNRDGGPLQFVTHGPIYYADNRYQVQAGDYPWYSHGIAPQYIGNSGGSPQTGVLLLEGLLWVWAKISDNRHGFLTFGPSERVLQSSETYGHRIHWKMDLNEGQQPTERWTLAYIRPEPICPIIHGVTTERIFPGNTGDVRILGALSGEIVKNCRYDHITGSGEIGRDRNVNIQYWSYKQAHVIVDADCEPPQ